MFRVPLLLSKSLAVVHRLSTYATQDVRPYTGATSGYDKDFRETITYDEDTGLDIIRDSGRVELPAIRIPCQVEPANYEALRQAPAGDTPNSDIQLVFHRKDLAEMNLINRATGELLIKVDDRVSHLEAYNIPGKVTVPFTEPGLFIFQIAPGSFGFGPDAYDLHIVYLDDRQRGEPRETK